MKKACWIILLLASFAFGYIKACIALRIPRLELTFGGL